MMKKVGLALLAIVVILGWTLHGLGKTEVSAMEKDLKQMTELGDPEQDEDVAKLREKIESKKNERVFTGILLAFLTAGLAGVLFVIFVLPAIAHRFTHAVYDSAEMVEKDPMHDARAKVAQGDWEGAIEAFRTAAAAEPLNRLPWVEIAKIQVDHLEDPAAAIATLRQAIEGQEWQESDAAYLMFRLAELYNEHLSDRMSAATIMQQVMEQFPETRHSANARHKLHEWGLV